MEIIRTNPPAELTPYFREFYFCRFRTEGADFIPVVDDGCHDLVFFKERNSLIEYGPDHQQLPVDKEVFTIHDLEPPYRILLNSELSFFTIKVQPWFNTLFFPVEGQQGIVGIDTFLGKHLKGLRGELFMPVSNEQRFKMVSSWLRTLVRDHNPEADTLVEGLCTRIYSDRGVITVSELEEAFGYSRQYLNARFKQSVSYSLKKFILIVRIVDLIKNRINSPEGSFTDLALEYGYFDQAHFNRDFKRVTGLTPRVFFKDLAPFFERHRM
ncbi:helix-turn-helix domain-containing protein [Robertkochia flava]|uniref:helix-turn-helix domain-containing protein n=1 Tax=Robertkochia flava TaxID=3447986 RepID=UPI001CCD4396|nr:helix-turn-helix transcriptional regulator [Robertkochia marina]